MTAGTAPAGPGVLRWATTAVHPELERTTIRVPVDHLDPAAGHLDLAVSRLRARDPHRRRGVLVALNGGPGGDESLGLLLPLKLADTPLADVYDLVGFDPRGYGESAPLFHRPPAGGAPFDSRPDDAGIDALTAAAAELERACAADGGALRRHTTTRNTARDLDLVRRALGEERLSYIGYAYGSYVGAVYGTLFGQRLDRCVLDSCVHPDWLWRKQFVMQASAIRDNVDAWAAWVARRDRRYGLGRDADAVLAAVEELAGRAAAAAVPGLDRTTLDGAVGNGATLRPSWDRLAGAVAALHRGDTGAAETAVGALGEFAASGLRAGTYPSATDEQRRMRAVLTERGALPAGCRPAVLHAVTHEARWPRDPEHYREDVHRVRRDQPYGYGIVRALPWVSSFAAEPPPEEPTTLRRAGSAPGLVVQGEGDPLNHHAGAIAMAHRLGHRLVLVTDDGGHELFPDAGNADVDRIVLRYLVDGELPAAPITRVAGRPRPDVPADDASR